MYSHNLEDFSDHLWPFIENHAEPVRSQQDATVKLPCVHTHADAEVSFARHVRSVLKLHPAWPPVQIW